MLNQLLDIVEHVCGTRPGAAALGARGDCSTPEGSLNAVRRICQMVVDCPPNIDAPHDLWRDVGMSLVGFLAKPPVELDQAIGRVASIPPEPARAWDEPRADAHTCLCALIGEIWEHCVQRDDALELGCLDAVEAHGADHIYDYGSGCGALATLLAGSGLRVRCYEPNPIKRLFLSTRAAALELGASLALGAAEPASHDAVLALDVLDHLEDPVKGVHHLAAALSSGGILLTAAAFPEDGWHAGPELGAAAERALHQFFEPEAGADTAWPGRKWKRNARACEPTYPG